MSEPEANKRGSSLISRRLHYRGSQSFFLTKCKELWLFANERFRMRSGPPQGIVVMREWEDLGCAYNVTFNNRSRNLICITSSNVDPFKIIFRNKKLCFQSWFNPLTGTFPQKILFFIVNSVFWLPRPRIELNFAEKAISRFQARFLCKLGNKMYSVLLLSMRIIQKLFSYCWLDLILFSFLALFLSYSSPLLLLLAFALYILSDSRKKNWCSTPNFLWVSER